MISPTSALTKVLDVVIVGGGLSGVMVAHELQKNLPHPGFTWRLLEARPILGGRLANDDQGHRIDLGGAWIWPDFQPYMKRLIQSLNIPTFLQPDDSSSTRIDGGAVELVHALAKTLPPNSIQLKTPVTNCTMVDVMTTLPGGPSTDSDSKGERVIRLDTPNGPVLAKRVVIAVPPKIASTLIQFEPALSTAKANAMKASHTWMAGVTKISLLFAHKFWTGDIANMGLPRQLPGPAFQVYDSSTNDETIHAITFFALVPPGSPGKDDDQILGKQVASQIGNVWSMYLGRTELKEQAEAFTDVHVKHWPTEKYISEDPDPVQIHPHPHPVGALATTEWDGRLLFAGSETDQQSPGVMEGAIGAALRVVQELRTSTTEK